MIPHGIRRVHMTDMEAVTRVHIARGRSIYGGLIDPARFDQTERPPDDRVAARHQRFRRTDIHTLIMTSPMSSMALPAHQSMKVWVLRGNPSRVFYPGLGAELVESHDVLIKRSDR